MSDINEFLAIKTKDLETVETTGEEFVLVTQSGRTRNAEIKDVRHVAENLDDPDITKAASNLNLRQEKERALESEELLNKKIENETNRSEEAETKLNKKLDDEIKRAIEAENISNNNVIAERDRAVSAESILTTNLDKEINRAKAKESEIDSELANRYTKDKVYTKEEVLEEIKKLINNAPEVLDTFGEIAEALGNDPNFATTITTLLAGKVDKVEGKGLSTNDFTDTYKNNLIDCNNKKHEHSNKSIIDKVTQALLDKWNSAYTHISDTVKHITSAERSLWNTVSNKAEKSHTHSGLDSKGRKTASDLPSTWAVGVYMTEVYRNGYPCDYGNCLTMKSSNNAITQICMEWKGSDATIGSMWIRNKRDSGADAWSAWREFSFSGHTHTKSQITDFPAKLSQFTNDSGFIKSTDSVATSSHTHSNKSVLDKITQALLDNWNSAYSHISDTIKHIVGRTIDGSFANAFRTQIKGNSSIGAFMQPIRNDTASVSNSPQYGTGIGFGAGDTHGYLYMNYKSSNAYIGAGNADKLNWTKELAFKDSNVASATKATQDSDGKQINKTYVKKGCTWGDLLNK